MANRTGERPHSQTWWERHRLLIVALLLLAVYAVFVLALDLLARDRPWTSALRSILMMGAFLFSIFIAALWADKRLPAVAGALLAAAVGLIALIGGEIAVGRGWWPGLPLYVVLMEALFVGSFLAQRRIRMRRRERRSGSTGAGAVPE